MKFWLIAFALAGLASCGADGEPVTPSAHLELSPQVGGRIAFASLVEQFTQGTRS